MAAELLPPAELDPHVRRVRRAERIGKGVLWVAAGFTVAVLALIVGYILVNGLIYRDVVDEELLPYASETFMLEGGVGTVEPWSVLVDRRLRLDAISWDVLRGVVGGFDPYLGYLTGQNVTATVVVLGSSAVEAKLASYLNLDAVSVAFVDSVEALRELARESRGYVVLAPASRAADLRGFDVVPVREWTVVVHPAVTELQAGQRLGVLTAADVDGLMSGAIRVWDAVGGPRIEIEAADFAAGNAGVYEPLPVVPVTFIGATEPVVAPPVDLLDPTASATAAVRATNVSAFRREIESRPGAIGIIRAPEADAYELTRLVVERRRTRANLRLSTFVTAPSRAGAVGGLSTIIINTVVMVFFVMLIAAPTGIAAAIYLVEYAKQGRLLNILRTGTDTLAGIPSIIFGLFGMVFFSQILGFKTGLLSGSLTLTLMILPTVVRTSEEALRAIPSSLRDGSLALGATKLQTIFRVVLPAASPGILTGIILGIGRAVGETAALLFTMGSNLALVRSFNSPMRVLSVHLYLLIRENISLANAFAAATILVVIVFIVNFTTTRLVARLNAFK